MERSRAQIGRQSGEPRRDHHARVHVERTDERLDQRDGGGIVDDHEHAPPRETLAHAIDTLRLCLPATRDPAEEISQSPQQSFRPRVRIRRKPDDAIAKALTGGSRAGERRRQHRLARSAHAVQDGDPLRAGDREGRCARASPRPPGVWSHQPAVDSAAGSPAALRAAARVAAPRRTTPARAP